jgi:hypothetical protein
MDIRMKTTKGVGTFAMNISQLASLAAKVWGCI